MNAIQWNTPLYRVNRWNDIQTFETTPFVFNHRLYRLENHKKSSEYPNASVKDYYMEDSIRVRDVETDSIITDLLKGHYFGIAFVHDGTVHVIAGRQRLEGRWKIKDVVMIRSRDLRQWSEPVKVLEAEPDEHIFNFGICHDGKRFVLLYETDDPRWSKFTFKYCESTDLLNWWRIDGALYGVDKYVGGPALYHCDGWFYTLYLSEEKKDEPFWATRITRSRDLLSWEDAPVDRPFLYPDPSIETNPSARPGRFEINASDAELCSWNGGTLVYFVGGDQYNVSDLQEARSDLPPSRLLPQFWI